MTKPVVRGLRAAGLLDREAAELVAVENGVCIRPLVMRRMDIDSGRSEVVHLPCGTWREGKCPACAKRYRQLRMAQCREGWHLEEEPAAREPGARGSVSFPVSDSGSSVADDGDGVAGPVTDSVGSCDPDEMSDAEYLAYLVGVRDEAAGWRERAAAAGEPTEDLDAAIADLDGEIDAARVAGAGSRRVRSTRRRQDAPDLPKRAMSASTLGRTFTTPDGKRLRPSMFVTLTLPSYGRVRGGVPVDPAAYDYRSAARDALHFSKLVDRFVQNLRRVAGFDVQYFAVVEPQRRRAPHLHMAIRGTLPRAELLRVIAATYHQVWWPSVDEVVFDDDHLPVWREGAGYVDAATGRVLPTWEEALDLLGSDKEAKPLHVARFGAQVDIQGVLAGTRDADQAIRYLSKYLTKSLGDITGTESGTGGSGGDRGQREHAARLVAALRYEPCSPKCANWLRYGVQPKNAVAGMRPGCCRFKAHRPDHLGYGGRRVLVSRKWSGKTLAGHKADRRAWVMTALGLEQDADGARRYLWRPVKNDDPGLEPVEVRLLREVARRLARRAALAALRDRPGGTGSEESPPDSSATGAAG